MKIVVLVFLIIIQNVVMASEKIFIGSISLTEPKIFVFHKTRTGQVEIYVEAFIDWGDDQERESESVEEVIPQLKLGKKRKIFYKGNLVGKVNGLIRRNYMIKSLMDIVTEKETYCSTYYKKDDCVSIDTRYNVYLVLH